MMAGKKEVHGKSKNNQAKPKMKLMVLGAKQGMGSPKQSKAHGFGEENRAR